MTFPVELPSPDSSSGGGVPRSRAGRCGLCGCDRNFLYRDWDEVGVCWFCVYDGIADAESLLRSSAIHAFTGCPHDPCSVCVMARG